MLQVLHEIFHAQTTELIVSICVKDNFITSSIEETLVVNPTLEATMAQDSASISTSKARVVTSEMK